ncbi:MAG: DUF1800 domain-containing protein [Acidobacteria bacterium]|nr:DUF1800 domain-containing protein [Acidobacteriota bacterium]
MRHGFLTLVGAIVTAVALLIGAQVGGVVLAAGLVSTTEAATRTTDPATILHVLSRITFGFRPADLERVQKIGLNRYIDEQLHPERLKDDEVQRRLEPFETLGLSSRTIAERYEIPALQARLAQQRAAGDTSVSQPAPEAARDPQQQRANLPMMELASQKIIRATYSERQLEEVLTDFWFNHFNVDARKGPTRFMLTEYERDVIRPHVLGHFRDLLGAVAKSPAMLFYLDNWMSADPNGPHFDRARPAGAGRFPGARRRGLQRMPMTQPRPGAAQAARQRAGLNENYGRELLELHTLGVDGGYTQKDVTEVARAFTGWTIEQPRAGGGFRFAPALHDDGEKVVLGRRIKAGGGERDGEEVLDIVSSHPSTAHFISLKLARRFVSDTPPDALVGRMATTFQKTHGDLREVMRVLLTSDEFLSADATGAKVKNPFEFVVSSLRATGADVRDARPLVRAVQQLGMPLYQCQPPTGYKDTADTWVNTGALVSRMNTALALASGKLPGARIGEIADPLQLIPGVVSDTTKVTIARAQAAPQAIALALGAPEFQRK